MKTLEDRPEEPVMWQIKAALPDESLHPAHYLGAIEHNGPQDRLLRILGIKNGVLCRLGLGSGCQGGRFRRRKGNGI
jgi:hypothetical protein